MDYILLSLKDHKAKTKKKCIWCYSDILIGETYTRHTYIFDEFTSDAYHADCYDVSLTNYDEYNEQLCDERHTRGQPCNHN